MHPLPKQRATAVIIKDGQILLIHRFKDGREYYVFPGGGVEEGESVHEALVREVMEELTLTVTENAQVLQYENTFTYPGRSVPETQIDTVFVVTGFAGTPMLGGPEKEYMDENNQFILEWHPIAAAKELEKLYPERVAHELRAGKFD